MAANHGTKPIGYKDRRLLAQNSALSIKCHHTKYCTL